MGIKVPHFIGSGQDKQKIILPEDAVTQGFGILARRRSGKSVLAGVMEETFLSRHDPFVVLDPASAHWGIKYAADHEGKPDGSSGFNVLVVGGKHGDVELDPKAGKLFAEIVCETNISAVVDLKMVGYSDRKRFIADFANRLFELNETPRHLIIEEAQELIPQVLRYEEQKAVFAAIERLIKGGGGQGLGFTLISQRPASVSKDCLTQIDNLFVLRMSGPQDIGAVEAWMEHNVGSKEQLRKIVSTLPHLVPGEAWILSPEWLQEIERISVRKRVTYHAGRTPKRGERPVHLKEVHVNEVAAQFRGAIKEKQAEWAEERESKAEAQRRLRQLEGEKASLQRELETVRKRLEKKVAVPVPAVQTKVVMPNLKELERVTVQAVRDVFKNRSHVFEQEKKVSLLPVPSQPIFPGEYRPDSSLLKTVLTGMKRALNGEVKLRDGARRMLSALLTWYPNSMTVNQMRAHAGLKKSGTFSAYMSDLRREGLVEQAGNMVKATEKAVEIAGEIPPSPKTTDEVLAIWNPKLRDGARRMLFALVNHRGAPLSKEDLASAAGIVVSGTFSAYLSDLKTARLAVVTREGICADRETLLLG